MPPSCGICGAPSMEVLYEGRIRSGKPGVFLPEPERVYVCGTCSVGFLPAETPIDYSDSAYRKTVDGSSAPEQYYRIHDPEQPARLAVVGGGLRGVVVADVGAGAGSFLDVARGPAARTIAIEPMTGYHEALRRGGHEVYSLAGDVDETVKGYVDLAVSFAVIEHVKEPVSFLREVRDLLKEGGRAVISTPNRADWLLELLGDDYASFFYRSVHRWYFNAEALTYAGRLAGFRDARVQFRHQYDASNLLLWLRDRKPTGLGRIQVDGMLDTVLRESLERSGRSNYLYVCFTR